MHFGTKLSSYVSSSQGCRFVLIHKLCKYFVEVLCKKTKVKTEEFGTNFVCFVCFFYAVGQL
jgi:hypothetical protein